MNDIKLDIKLDNTYVIECKSGLKIYGFTQEHYELIRATILDCIYLLGKSGENTQGDCGREIKGDCGMNYIYSIRPQHVLNIARGDKTYELRTKLPREMKEAINKGEKVVMWIYCTKGKKYNC